jgi:ribosomal protein L37AE/L43A
MQTRSHHPHDDIHSTPVMPCAQCGRMLFRPEWSEYVNERKVRHLWVCAACDYDFETIALFPAPARAEG